jgi:hypothetical protein
MLLVIHFRNYSPPDDSYTDEICCCICVYMQCNVLQKYFFDLTTLRRLLKMAFCGCNFSSNLVLKYMKYSVLYIYIYAANSKKVVLPTLNLMALDFSGLKMTSVKHPTRFFKFLRECLWDVRMFALFFALLYIARVSDWILGSACEWLPLVVWGRIVIDVILRWMGIGVHQLMKKMVVGLWG